MKEQKEVWAKVSNNQIHKVYICEEHGENIYVEDWALTYPIHYAVKKKDIIGGKSPIEIIADKDKEIARLTAENERLRAEKTCRNLSENNPVDEFICSKCGFMTEEFCRLKIDEDDGEHYHREYEIKYCPNCGAKVENQQ